MDGTQAKKVEWQGPTTEIETCLAPVRWRNGVLQQKWSIATVTDGEGSCGVTVHERVEWRDVPGNAGKAE